MGASGMAVPCETAAAPSDVEGSLNDCFGRANTQIWTQGLGALQTVKDGRSNLWSAVGTAHDYLVAKADLTRPNHIVVLTDGPDTCTHGENFGSCLAECAGASTYLETLAAIEATREQPNSPKVHIHFVQFESKGYPGSDPRQVELACITNGHYQHINTNDLPPDQRDEIQQQFKTAMLNVRYSLMGHWKFALDAPAFKASSGPPAGTPKGSLYALEGRFTMKTSSKLWFEDRSELLQHAAPAAPDKRLVVRKPCASAIECGATEAGAESSWHVVCGGTSGVCLNGAQGIDMPDTITCEDPNGSAGFCCEGSCETTNSACTACN